jgi:hypothetical protein
MVCHVGLRWWVKRKNREIVEQKKKDKRSEKQKLKKFKYE